MLYKNKKFAFKDLPDFQDGDIIDGGNYAQSTVTDISANLTIRGNPNMMNCNLTGNITAESNYLKVKKNLCYWVNCEFDDTGQLINNPMNLPVEQPDCEHVDPTKVKIIETDSGLITDYSEAREDIIL